MQTGASEEKAVRLLDPGDMFGDYTVEKLLGQGGMGAVYLVRAPGGERYAVKVMFPDMVKKGSDYRKRFAREAEFAMQIHHKNLISVYDVGEDPETGLCYIIMDYVPGGSVADRLENNGPLPMAEAVSIAAQVALALEVAHRHGVIHRDIKPENIMFDADGTPKLADLGVAKFTDEAHKTTVTTTGMIIGTPAYMAPEQMMDSHHVDARADIYALGVVLYEMLTGKRPNEGSTAVELLAKAIKGEPLPDVRTMRPEISAAVAHVLSLMCAPKPEARPATALEAAHLLQKAATGRLVLPKKPPRAADAAARKRKLRFPFTAIAIVAGIVALCAAVAASLLNKTVSKPTQRWPRVQKQPIVLTNVIERTIVITNQIEQGTVTTNTAETVTANPLGGTNAHATSVSSVENALRRSEDWHPGPSSQWFVEWDKAIVEAKKTGKKLFVLHDGSDWCVWCKKLKNDVFDKPEFKEFAQKNFVLLYLDTPKRKPLCEKQEMHNSRVLKALEFAGGVPTVEIFSADGIKIGRIGGGGPPLYRYLDMIKQVLSRKGEPILNDDGKMLFSLGGNQRLKSNVDVKHSRLAPMESEDSMERQSGDQAPKNLPEGIHAAKANGYTWFYKFTDGKVELTSGKDSICLFPRPSGRVVIPDRIDGCAVKIIGHAAFYECSDMTEVVIPEGIEEIFGWYNFTRCGRLNTLKLPKSLKKIGYWTFEGCTGLKEFDFARIEGHPGRFGCALANCTNIERILADRNNPSVVSVDGVLYSRDKKTLLAYPQARTELKMLRGVTTIMNSAFISTAMTRIKIPEGVKVVVGCAFEIAPNLEVVEFPRTLTTIGHAAFKGSTALKSVIFHGNAPATDGDPFADNRDADFIVYVEKNSKGWSRAGSSKLPEEWPVGSKTAREIRHLGTEKPGELEKEGQVMAFDAKNLYEKDSTRAVQKALNAIFPGWKTSANRSRSRCKYSNDIGFVPEKCGRSNLVATIPESEESPVVLTRTAAITVERHMFTYSVRKYPSAGGGMRIRVLVNGKVVSNESIDDGDWHEPEIDLSSWIGQTVKFKVEHYPLKNNSHVANAFWSRLELR